MELQRIKKVYDEIGLDTIPIPIGQKFPPPPGWKTKSTEEMWADIKSDCNIAVKLGKVADLEADDLVADSYIGKTLDRLGARNIPTCRSKRGRHRFVKITDSPNDVTFSTWKGDFGKGEARIRDCYSLIPSSKVDNFSYFWEGDFVSDFNAIQEISWDDIKDFVNFKPTVISNSAILKRYLRYEPENWVYETFKNLNSAPKGSSIQSEGHAWPSRSEAEAALVARLDTCGFSYDEIEGFFKAYNPGHYADYEGNQDDYLHNLYMGIQRIGIRPIIQNLYNQIIGELQYNKIHRVILSCAHQLNRADVAISYEQLATFIGIDPNSKMGPYKSCKRLEEDGLIRIKAGTQRRKDQPGLATIFDITPQLTHHFN